jgi:hypothetical protein
VDNIYIGLLVYTGGGWWLDEPVLRQTVYAFKWRENWYHWKCSYEVGYLYIYAMEKCTLLNMLQGWWGLYIGLTYNQLLDKGSEQII